MAPVHRLAVELSDQGEAAALLPPTNGLVMKKRSPSSQNYREDLMSVSCPEHPRGEGSKGQGSALDPPRATALGTNQAVIADRPEPASYR